MKERLLKIPLASKVAVLRGLGPARAEALREAGIHTLRDLLFALPTRYVDRGSVVPLGDLHRADAPAGLVTVLGTLKELRQSTSRVQRMAITEALLEDGTGTLRLVFFNQPYLARALRPGERLLAFGPLVQGRGGLEMRGPKPLRPLIDTCATPVHPVGSVMAIGEVGKPTAAPMQ